MKYNDPDKSKVEQYSIDYMRTLRHSDPEEMLRLWNLGHFQAAIDEENVRKAESRTYSTHKVGTAGSTQKWLEEHPQSSSLDAA